MINCASCGNLVALDDRYCRHCGEPLTRGPSAGEKVGNPFLILKSRWGVFLAMLGFTLAWGLLRLGLEDPDVRRSDPALFLAAVIVLSGPIALWIYWSFRSKRIDVRRLIGRLPENYNWCPAIGILLVNMVFSLGAAIVVFSAIGLVVEPAARPLDTESITSNSPNPVLLNVSAATVAVLAPVFEELFFRGVLINRWAVKWRLGIAIFASALLFGIMHFIIAGGAFTGAFTFGAITAVLYIRTRTLLVPMALHIANNSLVVTLLILTSTTGIARTAASTVVDATMSTMIFGLALLALTAPILIWYLRKNWPRRDELLPYEASGDGPLPTNTMGD
ncbi:MAG: CPBP family glutamic-type intramembrane protease [Chloroflexi bacterium]|nr:CPBP family glutamic-type intramembrane protease [Chloroflexota bacterium]MCY3938021.1 CPBP family glutamic-type intramembrane protease [Chloroflexota bacterium]